MRRYVVGFLFSLGRGVVLIEKRKPEWQAGRLNGVGGKVEAGETPEHAMAREFWEEAGMATAGQWRRFCVLTTDHATEVTFFYARRDDWGDARSMTDERVVLASVDDIAATGRAGGAEVLPNLRWLLPMAMSLDDGESADEFRVTEVRS